MQDDQKLREVYSEYGERLMKVAYGVLGDYHMAEDVVQEALFKFSRMSDINFEKEKGLLIVMVRNKARDYQRKYYRVNTVSISEEKSELEKASGSLRMEERYTLEYECGEFRSRVFEELKKKNIVWYEIIVGLYVYWDDPETVAARLGMSLPHMRTTLSRARSWIRRTFGKEYRDMGSLR